MFTWYEYPTAKQAFELQLLSYVPAPQQLCDTRSCGKRDRKGHFHSTHAEPMHATGRPRHSVQSCSAQAGRFLGIFPDRAAALCRPRMRQECSKAAWHRLLTPAPATGAARTHLRRQCPTRLCKNQGYKTSLRSALPADGEANTGTRTAETPSTNRRRRRGLAQRRTRLAHGAAPRKRGSSAGTRRARGRCLVAIRLGHAATGRSSGEGFVFTIQK
jgi:hypothetical protein